MALGLSLGTPATQASGSGGFSFGTPPVSKPATPGFSLGLTPATSAPGLGFGTPAATAASTGLFGAPAATPASTGLFGAPAASQPSTGFGFGTPAASTQPAPGFSFGTPAASTQASTGLTFGAPAASTQASTGFSFGTPAASTQPSTGFGLGSAFGAPVAAPAAGGFGAPAASAAPASSAPFVGLGGKLQVGLGGATSGAGISSAVADMGKTDGKPAKESAVQEQILQTVETFRAHVKAQKAECEQISRHSWAPVNRVAEETAALRQLLSATEASVQRHATAAAKLKSDVCDALKSAEVAQRTSEISAGLQYENTAPQQLFEQLVGRYEAAMVQYRRQIDQLERLLSGAPGAVTPEELMRAIRQLHETFVWLAGHLQTVHEKVQSLKEHYLVYRRTVLGDGASPAEIFPAVESVPPVTPERAPPVRLGPSPFAVDRTAASAAAAQALGQTPRMAAPAVPTQTPAPAGGLFGATAAFGAGTGGLFGSPAPAFGAAAPTFGAAGGSGLKLDPPPGSKRGKVN